MVAKNQKDRPRNDTFWIHVEKAVDRFEQAWAVSDDVDLDALIASINEPYRSHVLIELIKLDQEKRWSTSKKSVEDYLDDWPVLKELDGAVISLVQAEIETRSSHGDDPTDDEIARRFPALADAIDLETLLGDRAEPRDNLKQFALPTPVLDSITTPQAINAPGKSIQALPRGHMLGRYRVLSILGRGGMGIVYLASDDELDRLVAVKLLLPWIFGPNAEAPLLLKEARTAAQLRHAHILPIYDVGTTSDGSLFFVMEYVEGQTLEDLLKSRRLTIYQTIKICIQVAEALEVAHQAGITHRDVKPANILLDENENVRVTDFGLAVRHTEQRSEEFSGTVLYMAPEQFEFGAECIDPRIDIWALGVVLNEMVTFQRPFLGDSFSEIADAISHKSPTPPRQLVPNIPQALERVCLKCLEKNPDDRYQSARAIADALTRMPVQHRLLPLAYLVPIAAILLTLIVLVASQRRNSQFSPPHLSELQAVETSSFLSDCKLVLCTHTGASCDIEKLQAHVIGDLKRVLPDDALFRFAAESQKGLAQQVQIRDGWLTWELPLKTNNKRFLDKDAYWLPKDLTLTVRLAVNKEGVFQIGTISKRPSEHLLVFANESGITNYKHFLSEGIIDANIQPMDSRLENSEKQNLLSNFLAHAYANFREANLVRDGPDNGFDLYRCPFELRNYFESPITVVHGRIAHQQYVEIEGLAFDYEAHLRRPQVVQQAFLDLNRRWSPAYEQPNQNCRLSYLLAFEYREDLVGGSSALFLRASVDDDDAPGMRNASYITSCLHPRSSLDLLVRKELSITKGLLPSSPQSLDHWISNTSGNPQSFVDIREDAIKAGNLKRCGATVVVMDQYPSQIELIADSRYSIVKPCFKFAFLGKLADLHCSARAQIFTGSQIETVERKIDAQKHVFLPTRL